MASGINEFERNESRIEFVCVINRKLHTHMIPVFPPNRCLYRVIRHLQYSMYMYKKQNSYFTTLKNRTPHNPSCSSNLIEGALLDFYRILQYCQFRD